MSSFNEQVINALNAFAARGMYAEQDALAYCREMCQRYTADEFSSSRFMDNFRIAAMANDASDVCSECNGTEVVYDRDYGCDCICGACYDGDADTFEGALWRATAPRPR